MKRILITIGIMTIFGLTACGGPLHGSYKNYQSGNWWGWATNEEAARWEQDQLAIAKLANSVASIENATCAGSIGNTVTVSQGYKGSFFNQAREPRNVICSGPERRSFYLEPVNDEGDIKDACFIPGIYECVSYDMRGREIGRGKFRSGPQKHEGPKGAKYHWYYVVGQ